MNSNPRPWWLTEGSELCDFCDGSFHFEAAFYCVECDSPVCTVCVVVDRVQSAIFCPECHKTKMEV